MAFTFKEGVVPVHRNLIWDETVKKELRHITLTTECRPTVELKKLITPKITECGPTTSTLTKTRGVSSELDEWSSRLLKARIQTPPEKFPSPASSNQEYGWFSKPLIQSDPRFLKHLTSSPESKFAEVVVRHSGKLNESGGGSGKKEAKPTVPKSKDATPPST